MRKTQNGQRIPASHSAGMSEGRTDQQLFTTEESAAYLRVSKSYLDKLRVYGGGPPFLRPGKRKVLYRKSDLDAWLASQSFGSTSEYEAPCPVPLKNRTTKSDLILQLA
jgi:excisionase family DNA binding protein